MNEMSETKDSSTETKNITTAAAAFSLSPPTMSLNNNVVDVEDLTRNELANLSLNNRNNNIVEKNQIFKTISINNNNIISSKENNLLTKIKIDKTSIMMNGTSTTAGNTTLEDDLNMTSNSNSGDNSIWNKNNNGITKFLINHHIVDTVESSSSSSSSLSSAAAAAAITYDNSVTNGDSIIDNHKIYIDDEEMTTNGAILKNKNKKMKSRSIDDENDDEVSSSNSKDIDNNNIDDDDDDDDIDASILPSVTLINKTEKTDPFVTTGIDQSKTDYSEMNANDDMHIVEIKLSDIKTNHSEFGDFIILFLYVSEVLDYKVNFENDSMTLMFKTKYDAFPHLNILNKNLNGQSIQSATKATQIPRYFVYFMNLYFKHKIVPQKSSVKITKKSIEIRLVKSIQHILWGSIKEACRLTAHHQVDTSLPSPLTIDTMSSSSIFSPTTFSLNTWTPCISQQINDSIYSDVMINSTYNNNNKALIKYNNDENVDNEDTCNIGSNSQVGKFRGFTGLDNLGNTCFMNAVLQCLANTDPLKDYFLTNNYLNDINFTNPLGMEGLMAKAFANFLTQLWKGKESSFSPHRLKTLMSEKVASFAGFSQHDAQELMSFMLDAIHEDLNKNGSKTKKRSNDGKEEKEEDSLLDYDVNDCPTQEMVEEIYNRLKEIAEKSWKQYKSFNDSIIIDLFCGQFKSILTCPDCSKKSIIFDPFLFVPLPIPPPKLLYQVIYFARDETTDMCKAVSRFSLKIAQNSTVNDLLDKLCLQKRVIPTKNVRLMQQQNQQFQDAMPVKFFNTKWALTDCQQIYNDDSNSSSHVSNLQPLLLFELPSNNNGCDDNQEEYIELCIIQRELRQNVLFRHQQVGFPFVVSIKKSKLTYSHLCTVLCSYARFSVIAYRQAINNTINHDNDSPSINRFNVQSFTPKNHSKSSSCIVQKKDSRTDNNSSNSPTTTNDLPHLVYHKTRNIKENDTVVPFLLNALSFAINVEDFEITPVEIHINNHKNDESDNNENDYPLNVDNLEESNKDSSEKEEKSQNYPCEEKEEMETEEKGEKENDDDEDEEMKVIFDNDQIIDLSNLYFIAMDWITVKYYEMFPFSVELTSFDNDLNYVKLSNEDDDITLNDCLQSFIEPEVLGPQNCWRCPKCKVLREASKQLSFWRLPPILVIQLKRFKTHSMVYNHEKIAYLVKYPLNELDLRKYFSNFECIDENYGGKVEPIYDLYAVVNHQGSPFWGHYTAFARSSHSKEFGWRLFDDYTVEKVDDAENQVITSKAYLLFYKRRDT